MNRLEFRFPKEVLKLHREPVFLRATNLPFLEDRRFLVSHGRLSHPGHQITGARLCPSDHLAVSIVGVCKKNELQVLSDRLEHLIGLIDQCSLVAVGANDPLMNSGAYRHAEVIAVHLAKDAKGLKRVAHDVLRLGVRLGLLMKELHAGHLAPFLGILDAVEKQDWPTIDEVNGKEPDYNGEPEFSKLIDLHGITVEEM